MTTQNNGSMTALEAGLEAVLFAAGDAVTIERLSAALEAAPAELLDAAAALENHYDFENRGIMLPLFCVVICQHQLHLLAVPFQTDSAGLG